MKLISLSRLGYTFWKEVPREAFEAVRAAVPQLNFGEEPPDWFFVDKLLVDDEQWELLCSISEKVVELPFRKLRLKDTVKPGIHVHIPSFGLLTINEVQVLTDACTDHLQSMLNEGWRILAICPPLDARRPDYIIGRTNNEG